MDLREAPKPTEGGTADPLVIHLAARSAAQIATEVPHATQHVLLRRNAAIPGLIDLMRREGLRASRRSYPQNEVETKVLQGARGACVGARGAPIAPRAHILDDGRAGRQGSLDRGGEGDQTSG